MTSFLAGAIVNYEKYPILYAVDHVYDIIDSKDTDDFTEKVRHSVAVIEEAVNKYRYTFT